MIKSGVEFRVETNVVEKMVRIVKYGQTSDSPIVVASIPTEAVTVGANKIYKIFEEVTSYLNAWQVTQELTEKLLRQLLIASLDRAGLGRVQNDVAKFLRYEGIQGFINETCPNPSSYKIREKEERIISNDE